MQKEKIPRKLSIRIARIVLKTILFIFLFVLLVFILLLTPPVQRVLTTKVQHYLENKLHTKVLIGRISFGLSGKVGLRNVYIEEKTKNPDTAQSAPMKLSINDIDLENVTLAYTDVIAGSDMFAHIGEFTASIDTFDLYSQHFVIPSFILRNSSARMKQIKPLVEPKPLEEHIAEAVKPSPVNLKFGSIDLSKIS